MQLLIIGCKVVSPPGKPILVSPQPTLENEIAEAAKIRNYEEKNQMRTVKN